MRIGIDLGGTKIELIALEDNGSELLRERVPTPKHDYGSVLAVIGDLVSAAEEKLHARGSVGMAIPGIISPTSGRVKNANSTALIGHALDKDLSSVLRRSVRLENDANCFALSEATDGAGAGKDVVFGIIAGTGVGGGLCVGGRLLRGAHVIAGEWGHNPLPWPTPEELPGPECYCGKRGCIESWCSGPAFSEHFAAATGRKMSSSEIAAAAVLGDREAAAAIEKFLGRLSRAIATVVNILDPDVIVLGGGLSNIERLYAELPALVADYCFNPESNIPIVRNQHGDSSGVRGAAWLWPREEIGAGLP